MRKGMQGVRLRRLAGAWALLPVLAGCDLTVTNPGPVQDQFLNDEQAFPAVLQGARRINARAFTRLALDAAMVAREAVPGGLFDTQFKQGVLTSRNSDGNWNNVHEGRWVAEDGVRRLREVLGSDFASNRIAAELLVLAAYANRTLGQNMCIAVFDGGPEEPYMAHFDRAEAQFTEAISIAGAVGASALVDAAKAGRADVRMWKNDWAGAVSDAAAVPRDATFQLHYYDLDFDDANELMFRQAGLPWREYTVWNTFAEDYYLETGDPRMAWRTNPADPVTMVDNLPFYVQLKFTEFTSPHTLSSGWEMLLIRAEEILVNDPARFQDAVALINEVRTRNASDLTDAPLEPVTASSVEDAWTALKQERRIELWLEGRRFADLRRWARDSRPGVTPMEDMAGRSGCFPVGITEVNTNPHGLREVS